MARLMCHGLDGLGLDIIVDDDKVEYLRQFRWGLSSNGYVMGTINKKSSALHRHSLNYPKGRVDHKNGNKLDNRLSNLRVATHAQNLSNASHRIHSKTRIKGVWPFRGKYRVGVAGVQIGLFIDIREAAHVYNQVAEQIYGEFAKLNNLDEIEEVISVATPPDNSS